MLAAVTRALVMGHAPGWGGTAALVTALALTALVVVVVVVRRGRMATRAVGMTVRQP